MMEKILSMFREKNPFFCLTLYFLGEYTEHSGYIPALTDHFFLTDPAEFIFTHFPHSNSSDYNRWQLLSSPISLKEFNRQPHVSSEFFTLGCSLVTQTQVPAETEHYLEIAIHANEVYYIIIIKQLTIL